MPVKKNGSTCKECNDFVAFDVDWKQKEIEFKNVFDKQKGKGKYDCMVLLTGGKDSSFVLYYMTKVIGARVLAFTWDNGFIRDQSWENMRNAVEATGCDHEVFKYDPAKLKTLFRSTFKMMGSCCFCPTISSMSALSTAAKHDIPMIMTGFSEGQRFCDHSYDMPTPGDQRKMILKFYKLMKNFFIIPLRKHEPDLADETHRHIMAPLTSYVQSIDAGKTYPALVPLSNYVDWTSSGSLEEILSKNLNWVKPSKAITRTSCFIEPIKGYFEHQKKGLNTASEISCLIRIGAVTREDGLAELNKMYVDGTRPDSTTIEKFINFLGITEAEFDHYGTKRVSLFSKIKYLFLLKNAMDIMHWILGTSKAKAKRFIPGI
ncbi:MAG: hypothetical protein ABFS09_00250 [Thermodesulfobacteriota bacterium]